MNRIQIRVVHILKQSIMRLASVKKMYLNHVKMHRLCLRLTSSHFIATNSIHFLINVRVDIEMKRKMFYAKIQSVSLH
jgi:hypothetical protein